MTGEQEFVDRRRIRLIEICEACHKNNLSSEIRARGHATLVYIGLDSLIEALGAFPQYSDCMTKLLDARHELPRREKFSGKEYPLLSAQEKQRIVEDLIGGAGRILHLLT
ncbi:MAG: hypothetical protein ACREGH_04430 [Minisyncoccia bacterium]